MAGRYKAYPAYKDSGVEWLGEIPEGWSLYHGKRIFKSSRQKAFSSDEQLAVSQRYGVIPQKIMMKLNNAKVMLALKGTEGFTHVNKNNYVISLRSFEGGIEYSLYEGCVSPAYTVLESLITVDYNYYKYLFKCQPFIAALQSTTDSLRDGKSISYEQFGTIEIPLTDVAEQQTIAQFLDYETAKIDALIAKQEQLIELLKEKRQAVISHAVTKGLNPDAPMKDSGVEWLGQVPEHWEVLPLKRVMELNPSKAQLKIEKSRLCSFIPMEKLKRDKIILDEERVINEVFDGYTYFENGDVLVAKVTPCFENNNIAVAKSLVNGIGFGSSEIYVLRCSKSIQNVFLYYRLQEEQFMNIAVAAMTGAGGLKRVPSEVLNGFKIALPPVDEQVQILHELKNNLNKFDSLDKYAHNTIELLQERKTALISAAVTGKIDVRDWQPPSVG